MRTRTAILALTLLAAGCGGGKNKTTAPPPPPVPRPSPAVRVSITAATHRPKVNAKLHYEVKAPGRGTITVEIVDPFGGVHAVQYDDTKRNITNFPFKGVFRDYVEFPPESRGFKLTVRATVKTAAGRGVATYWIRSR